MIQQIVITDYMSDAAHQPIQILQTLLTACPDLLRANWVVKPQAPLTACLNQLMPPHAVFNVESTIAGLLSLIGTPSIKTGFCLIPVKFHMQRDTYSLQGSVQLSSAAYQQLTTLVRAHFTADFHLQCDASERYWWVTPHQAVDASCAWPQHALFQQAFHWQPQGPQGNVLRQWSNEMQMLLHQAVHATQNTELPTDLNGLWFARINTLPRWQHTFNKVSGDGALFAALHAAGLPLSNPCKLHELYGSDANNAHTLFIVDTPSQVDWHSVQTTLAQKKLHQLKVVLPFAEQHVEAVFKAPRWWQRWRTPPNSESLLMHLHAQLTQSDTA